MYNAIKIWERKTVLKSVKQEILYSTNLVFLLLLFYFKVFLKK